MSYEVTTPDDKKKHYQDINRAVADSPHGSKIKNTKTGAEYKVVKDK